MLRCVRAHWLLAAVVAAATAWLGGPTAKAEGPPPLPPTPLPPTPLPPTQADASQGPERISAALSPNGTLLYDRGLLYLVHSGHAATVPANGGRHYAHDVEASPRGKDIITIDYSIATDESSIYATTGAGILMRIPKAGGRAVQVGSYVEEGHGRFAHVALDGRDAYVTYFSGSAVLRIPKAGGRVETLYSDPERRAPGEIALDGRSVYWVNQVDGSVMRMPKAGGSPSLIAKGLGRSFGLAVDASRVYFTEFDGGRVLAAPLSGGETVAIATGQGTPAGLVLDDARVYFSDPERGTIVAVRKDAAGGPVVLASGQPMPASLAVGGDYLYWVNVATGEGDGALMRIRRPLP